MKTAPPPANIPAKITKIEQPAPDVRIIHVQPLKHYDYLAGQYCFVQTDDNPDMARPFSIACAPNDDNHIEFHIKYSGYSVSEWLFNAAKIGSIIYLSDPCGDCTYRNHNSKSRPILAIAGGVGISQIKAIIEQLITDHSAREIILYEGVRRRHDLYLIEYWNILESTLHDFNFRPVFSEEEQQQSKQRTGLVGHQVSLEMDNLHDYDIYLAGPPAMVDDVIPRLIEKDADPQKIFKD